MGYLSVEDVDAKVAAIESEGGKALMPPMDLPVGRIAMVTDPQGVPFSVMKPVPPADDPDTQRAVFSPMEAQHFRWTELSPTDPDAALDFSARTSGWPHTGQMPMGDLG